VERGVRVQDPGYEFQFAGELPERQGEFAIELRPRRVRADARAERIHERSRSGEFGIVVEPQHLRMHYTEVEVMVCLCWSGKGRGAGRWGFKMDG